MNVVITSEILQAYSLCPRKAYLLMHGKDRGELHEYEKILEKHQLENQTENLKIIEQRCSDIHPYSTENLKKDYEFLIDANLSAEKFQAYCSILKRIDNLNYEPTIFIGTYKINDIDKLKLVFIGYVLAKIQGKSPKMGHIVNVKGESRRLKLEESNKLITPLLAPLEEWISEPSIEEVPVILNKHCPICQFREKCKEIAIREDNLSLLDKVTPKVLRQYEKKGIFTVKQLSYLFKPRKRKRRAKKSPAVTHDVRLQALAIRTRKIYLQEMPDLPRQEIEIYLDIEGLPDQNLYYLIGVLVCQRDVTEYHSLWADNVTDEEKIWQEFLAIVNQYPDAPIYHYGSYEVRAIKVLDKRFKTEQEVLLARLDNVNKQIYGRVYFPVYSNKLKEVASFLGATWTSPNASGIQSLVWRHRWNESQEVQYKSKLITYNKEDCYALKLLADELRKIQQSADALSAVDFAQTPKENFSEIGGRVSSQFEMILRFASAKYEKRKISFRQGQVITKNNRGGSIPSKTKLRPDKILEVSQPESCIRCGHSPLKVVNTKTSRTI